MRNRKIVSLVLAILMLLSTLPMAFLSVAADVAADPSPTPQAATPQTATLVNGAPEKLPNGSYYTGSAIFNVQNVGFNYTTNQGTWIGDSKYTDSALDALNNASGVMFKMMLPQLLRDPIPLDLPLSSTSPPKRVRAPSIWRPISVRQSSTTAQRSPTEQPLPGIIRSTVRPGIRFPPTFAFSRPVFRTAERSISISHSPRCTRVTAKPT